MSKAPVHDIAPDEQVYAHPSGKAQGQTQKLFASDEGANVVEGNPYRDFTYEPQPGRWDLKGVREGTDNPDFVTGRDVVS